MVLPWQNPRKRLANLVGGRPANALIPHAQVLPCLSGKTNSEGVRPTQEEAAEEGGLSGGGTAGWVALWGVLLVGRLRCENAGHRRVSFLFPVPSFPLPILAKRVEDSPPPMMHQI